MGVQELRAPRQPFLSRGEVKKIRARGAATAAFNDAWNLSLSLSLCYYILAWKIEGALVKHAHSLVQLNLFR